MDFKKLMGMIQEAEARQRNAEKRKKDKVKIKNKRKIAKTSKRKNR
jgi:hypothetical protein